jgi:NADH:ubiquinone oxidoreductase subunit E
MSEGTMGRSVAGSGKDLPGFFGAEQLPPTEEFDPEIFTIIDDFLKHESKGRESLIPLLHRAQARLGYLPYAVQEYVAEKLDLSPVQVYGVISFYHFFTTTPRARFQVKVCMGTACFVRNAQKLLDGLKETCEVEIGGISQDKLFNLDQVRCIGACGLAPAITVNDDVHGNLTVPKARSLAKRLKRQAEKERRAGS